MPTDDTLSIPKAMRRAVLERDGGHCRVCGGYLRHPTIHHIVYGGDARGMGGRRRHVLEELVTIGSFVPDADCHSLVHSDKARWQPLLLAVVRPENAGLTAFQLARYQKKAAHD